MTNNRAKNPDGTPWWVSTGPPTPGAPRPTFERPQPTPTAPDPATEQPRQDPPATSTFLGMSPEVQTAAINSGLGLVTAMIDLIAKPQTTSSQAAPELHDPATCGVCPLCVAVGALREHDEGLANLVESAMSGVTESVEKLTGMLPHLVDSVGDAVVSAVVKAVLNRGK